MLLYRHSGRESLQLWFKTNLSSACVRARGWVAACDAGGLLECLSIYLSHLSLYIYTHIHIPLIYIYIYIERETDICICICMYVCIYIYICIYGWWPTVICIMSSSSVDQKQMPLLAWRRRARTQVPLQAHIGIILTRPILTRPFEKPESVSCEPIVLGCSDNAISCMFAEVATLNPKP